MFILPEHFSLVAKTFSAGQLINYVSLLIVSYFVYDLYEVYFFDPQFPHLCTLWGIVRIVYVCFLFN